MSRPLTPTGRRLLVALYELTLDKPYAAVTATDLAHCAKLGNRVRRAGHGARKGSYSGWQQPGFVMGPACAQLARKGFAWVSHGYRGMAMYRITGDGVQEATQLVAAGYSPDTPLWWDIDIDYSGVGAVYETPTVRMTCQRCGHGGRLEDHGPDKCPDHLGWEENR